MTGMLAVAFGPKTMREALDVLPDLTTADCVELRLDSFDEPFDVPALVAARPCPLVVTLRPPSQGGFSSWSDDERRAALLRAAACGAEYVDIEYDALEPAWLAAVRANGARVLVSRHDFTSMPDLPNEWWPALAEMGADIIKVVGVAHDVRDCLNVFRTFRRADRPTVAIAMGEAGLPTRVLALREEACFLTYAARDDGQGTAAGQIGLSAMQDTYRARQLGPATAAYGLLGSHVEHALAAQHNRWFAAAAVDGVAVPFVAAADAPDIVSAFRELPMDGWHVHGEDMQSTVGQAVDILTPAACRSGKVNAITLVGDALAGDWVETPAEQFRAWTGIEPSARIL